MSIYYGLLIYLFNLHGICPRGSENVYLLYIIVYCKLVLIIIKNSVWRIVTIYGLPTTKQ